MANKKGKTKESIILDADQIGLTGDSFTKELTALDIQTREAEIKKSLLIKEALSTDDPTTILKAQSYLKEIEERGDSRPKSLILDNTFFSGQGWKEKSYSVSYDLLRGMARTPIIKSIIETRVEQVVDFMTPQEDRYSTGFIIRPKRKAHFSDEEEKLKPEQIKRASEITDWIMNCGPNSNAWHGDDIDSFTRKVIRDSLSFDQMTWENVENRRGDLTEIIAVDGASFRLSDKINEEDYEKLTSVNQVLGSDNKKDHIKGYPPYYVQVYQGRIISQFYPWELCFGIRNAQTSILSNGYGRSELEDLVNTVTSLLNVDSYNANYFKVGSNPKGILRVTGNVSNERLDEFKAQWQAQMAGVHNAHKLPVIEADKMDFITTQGTNKEMEYSKYQEFLIKVGCAVFKMDPSEIGFPMQGSSEAKPMFEGNNEARLTHSKDKGLKPLIKFYERKFQRYVIDRLDPEYEIKFVGLNAYSPEEELEAEIKKVSNFKTVNETRKEFGLKELPDGDIILNPVMMQNKQMEAMNGGGGDMSDESDAAMDSNPFDWDDEEETNKSASPGPIAEALEDYINSELT
tara:strand:+ start:1542 stop:3260 length:1719 start_codon:yes stop_codon:yes gene_type:complete